MSTAESSDPSTSYSLTTFVAATEEPEASTSRAHTTNAASKSWKQRLGRKQLGRHLNKSTAVYCVIIASVWIIHAIPIVAFYSSAPKVGQQYSNSIPGTILLHVICKGITVSFNLYCIVLFACRMMTSSHNFLCHSSGIH